MVVPIPLDDAAQATVDAARATESGKAAEWRRVWTTGIRHGVIVSIVQAGRIPGGQQAVVVKGEKTGADRVRDTRAWCGVVGRGDRTR